MPDPDDKLDDDNERGQKDINAQVRRFNRVNNILQRAIRRFDMIIADVGAPSADPQVKAALQAICNSAGAFAPAGSATGDGIIVKVYKSPGPIQDPADPTLQNIKAIGLALVAAVDRLPGGGTAPP